MTAPVFATSFAGLNPVAGTASMEASGTATTDRQTHFGTTTDDIRLTGSGRTSGSAGFHARRSASGTSFNWELRDNAGNSVFRVNQSASNTFQFQYWNGSAWTNIGGTWTWTTAIYVQFRVDFAGLGGASGSATWRMFTDSGETDLGTGTASGLNFSSMANVAEAKATYNASGDVRYGGVFIRDGSGAATYVYSNVPTADGADVDGTGTFASIDDTGASYDTDFISLPASGNRRSVKNSEASSYDGRTVKAIGFPARLRCGATGPTQCKPYLKIGGTRYYYGTVTLTTSFTSYVFVWETDPSTSAAWTLTAAQAAAMEYGIEVV